MKLPNAILTIAVATSVTCLVRPCAAEDPPQLQQVWGFTGTGPGQFQHPFDLKLDASGNVYVADTGNKRIQEFSNTGQFLRQLASGAGDAAFGATHSCVVDNLGNLYVQDDRGRIDVFNASGQFIRSWPSQALYLALDPTSTYLYANTVQDSIIKYETSSGARVTAWSYFSGQSWHGFAVGQSGTIYIAGFVNVLKYAPDGTLLGSWGSYGSGPGQFNGTGGVGVDPTENVYVVDAGNARIQKFTSNGGVLSTWGTPGAAIDQFGGIIAVTADASGHVFVLDHDLNRVQKFGYVPTAIRKSTWGELKSTYR